MRFTVRRQFPRNGALHYDDLHHVTNRYSGDDNTSSNGYGDCRVDVYIWDTDQHIECVHRDGDAAKFISECNGFDSTELHGGSRKFNDRG